MKIVLYICTIQESILLVYYCINCSAVTQLQSKIEFDETNNGLIAIPITHIGG